MQNSLERNVIIFSEVSSLKINIWFKLLKKQLLCCILMLFKIKLELILLILLFFVPFSFAKEQWFGSEYQLHSKSQQIDASSVINNIEIKEVKNILDIGCGVGYATRILAEKYPNAHITAIDQDVTMIEQATERLRKYKNINVTLSPIQKFHSSTKFDLVTAFHVLHWVNKKEQSQVLENIKNLTKNNGIGIFILAPSKDGLPFQAALNNIGKNKRYKDYFNNFTNSQTFYQVDEYRNLLEKAGFFVSSIGYFYNEKSYKDKTMLINWLKQWLPHYKHLAKIDNTLSKQFMNDLANEFIKISNQDGQHTLIWGEYVLVVKTIS